MAVLRHIDFEIGHSGGMLVNVYNNTTGSLLGAFQNPGVISEPIPSVPAYDINIGSITGNWLVDVFISGVRTGTVFASESHLITEDYPPWLQASGSAPAIVDANSIRSAIGLSLANLDLQLINISGYVDTEIAAIKTKTDQLTFTLPNKVDVTSLVTSGISSTEIRSAIGLASANLDSQLSTIQTTNVDNNNDIANLDLDIFNLDQKVNRIPRSGETFQHRNVDNSTTAKIIIESI